MTPTRNNLASLVPFQAVATPAVQPAPATSAASAPAATPAAMPRPMAPRPQAQATPGGSLHLGELEDMGQQFINQLRNDPTIHKIEEFLQQALGSPDVKKFVDRISGIANTVKADMARGGGNGEPRKSAPAPDSPKSTPVATPVASQPGTAPAPTLAAPGELPVAVDGKLPDAES